MMKQVIFSCGHDEPYEFGVSKGTELERKIRYFSEKGLCSECYRKAQEAKKAYNCNEVTMFYGKYKREYSDCKTKWDSYDAKKKTVVVYVPILRKAPAKSAMA